MNFVDAIKSGFRNYVNFEGRASRSEFWYFTLFCLIGGVVTGFIPVVSLLFMAATFLPNIAVSARRLHDVGRSGFWLLIAFTGIGVFVLLYWCIKGSDEGANAFGPATN